MKITKALLRSCHPCREGQQFLAEFRSLRSAWKACGEVNWMLWALNTLKLIPDSVSRQFACDCARRVLPIFEKEKPKDFRPRKALQMAETMITKPAAYSGSVVRKAQEAANRCAEFGPKLAAISAWRAAQKNPQEAAWDTASSVRDILWDNKSAYLTEQQWQCDHLRELINPFKKQ